MACVGLLAALGFAASRWPRFVELAWGLGFKTLFSGNGGVNTKGLVQRVASLTLSVYVQAKLVGGGSKLMDGLDCPHSLKKHFALTTTETIKFKGNQNKYSCKMMILIKSFYGGLWT